AKASGSHFLFVVILLAILWSGPVEYAQADHCTAGVPPWVKDRQQYESSYVYAPAAGRMLAAETPSHIPQWVKDRQQYETSYVYVPLAGSVHPTPQWARDRQQYETNYVYVPPADGAVRRTVSFC